ncbi:MAG: hypothetical protein C0409_07600, partial [Novosphingobium sp.]|nr:hypothetical protein [Novosphingobium sp.]
VLLGLCVTLVLVLAFRVNALRSQIHHAEARIVALKQDKMYLETEFETRANQQQLKVWNDVEFGYAAPNASQYLEGERQLAALSMPTTVDAPEPIRVASVDDTVIASAAFPAMVSPLSGKALASDDRKADADDEDALRPVRMDHDEAVVTLKERLGKVVEVAPSKPVRKETVSEKDRAEKAPSAKKPAKQAAVKPEKAKPAPAKTKNVTVADKSSVRNDKTVSGSRPAARKEAKAAR